MNGKNVAFMTEAIRYFNSLESPLKSICLDERKFRLDRKDTIGLICSATILVVSIASFIFNFKILNFDYLTTWAIQTVLCVFGIVNQFRIIISILKYSYKHHSPAYSKDYQAFLELLPWDYSISITHPIIKLDDNGLTAEIVDDSNIVFELFYRVKTFTLDSFLEATRQKNEKTVNHILSFILLDIIKEAEALYQEHLDFEKEVKAKEEKKLKEQTELELGIYNNRMFKKESKSIIVQKLLKVML